jgi:hypothetical protein
MIKGSKFSGACGMRSCYGSVGPPEGHAPRYLHFLFQFISLLAQIFIVLSLEERTKESKVLKGNFCSRILEQNR